MTIAKAFVSFRIAPSVWMPEHRFRELMALFEKHHGVTDEVTFFTSETHPCLPLDVIRERARILMRRMMRARELGYRAGINVLSTIGHHNENLSHSLVGDFTRLTDLDGQICQGSLCPNDESVRRYIKALYESIASAGPDYVWVDDDVRLYGHMPITAGCFCDRCLEIFEGETGRPCTRRALKTAFDADPLDQKLAMRKSWIEHNRKTIARLLALIEQAVHELQPGLPLGFMTGDRFYEGYDFDTWAGILAGRRNAEVWWRPGGGFYSDEVPGNLVGKSHDIGRQVAMLPASVQAIQSEIENFTYQRLKKAERMTALEAASHIAAGATGAAFNVLSQYDEPLDEYEPLVAALHGTRPFLNLLARTLGRAEPCGVYTGWTKDTFAASGLDAADWLAGGVLNPGFATELFEIGLPASYSLKNARVTVLTADTPAALSDAEARTILSGGVYLDARALTRLNEMGYGEFTGFTVDRFLEYDCIEALLDHPLNRPFVGRIRDGRQSFRWWSWPGAVLRSTDGKAQALSRLVDYAGHEVASCTAGLFENTLGGRVCVAGYFPWTFLQNLSKSWQVKALFRWLAQDALPAYVASFHKANLWVRQTDGGRLAVTILIPSLDEARNVVLMLRTCAEEITVYDMDCRKTVVGSSGSEGPYRRFLIANIPAWSMILATT